METRCGRKASTVVLQRYGLEGAGPVLVLLLVFLERLMFIEGYLVVPIFVDMRKELLMPRLLSVPILNE